MHSPAPTPTTPIGLPGCAVVAALAAAVLALSLGLLAAALAGPLGVQAKGLDGWNQLLSGDLRAALAFAMPCLAWLAMVIAYVRNAPTRALARAALDQTHCHDEAIALPAGAGQEHAEPTNPAQIRKPFHEALREDGVDLALSRHSRPAGLQAGMTSAHKEEDEMLKRQMAVMVLAGAGVVSCGVENAAPEGNSTAVPTAPIEAALKEGMAYADFRRFALASGWKPSGGSECLLVTVGSNFRSECHADPNRHGCVVCSSFPELEACSQDGFCYMTLTKDGRSIHLTTYGEILDVDRKEGGNPPFITKWNISED